jgi:hypothetical protein
MNIRRAVIAAAGGAAAAALTFGAIPVGAQETLLPISVTPTSGPAGTVATVSGADCIGEAGPGDLLAYMWGPTSGPEDPPIGGWAGTVAADGSWTAPVQFEASDAVGTYTISATCFVSPDSDDVVAEYDFVDFELTAADPAPAPPAEQPAVEPAAAPVAAPAPAVRSQPRYAG